MNVALNPVVCTSICISLVVTVSHSAFASHPLKFEQSPPPSVFPSYRPRRTPWRSFKLSALGTWHALMLKVHVGEAGTATDRRPGRDYPERCKPLL